MLRIWHVALVASLAALLYLVGSVALHTTDSLRPLTCAEDEPCWDCATMGNLICGRP